MDEKLPPRTVFPALSPRVGLVIILLASLAGVLSAVAWIFHRVHQSLGAEIAEVVVAMLAILILGLVFVGIQLGFSTKRALRKRHDHAERVYFLLQRFKTLQEFWSYLGLDAQQVTPAPGSAPVEPGSMVTPATAKDDDLDWLRVMEEEIIRRGRTPDHSIERWARVIYAWEHQDPWNRTETLNEFLCQQFGVNKDGSPAVSRSSFYFWKKKIHQLAREYNTKKQKK